MKGVQDADSISAAFTKRKFMIYWLTGLILLIGLIILVVWSATDDLMLADEYKCPSDGLD
jgi:hypothetical protein